MTELIFFDTLVIPALLILGAAYKKIVKNRDSYIPIILIVIAVLFAVLKYGVNVNNILQGIIYGGSAVGLHQVKKQMDKE